MSISCNSIYFRLFRCVTETVPLAFSSIPMELAIFSIRPISYPSILCSGVLIHAMVCDFNLKCSLPNMEINQEALTFSIIINRRIQISKLALFSLKDT